MDAGHSPNGERPGRSARHGEPASRSRVQVPPLPTSRAGGGCLSGATKLLAINGRLGLATTLVGYLGPSLFGLGAAELIALGHIVAVLWLALLALALLLPLLRTVFSVVCVILTGSLLYLVARYATVGAQVAVGYGVAWYLLLSGIRMVIEDGSAADDAGNLAGLTRLPRGFWSRLWLAGCVAALLLGS